MGAEKIRWGPLSPGRAGTVWCVKCASYLPENRPGRDWCRNGLKRLDRDLKGILMGENWDESVNPDTPYYIERTGTYQARPYLRRHKEFGYGQRRRRDIGKHERVAHPYR